MDQKPTLDVYNQLQRAYDHYNETLFRPAGEMVFPCIITLQRKNRSYGFACRKRFKNRASGQELHELAMNPEYFAVVPLIEILQTLVHEMAHLWEYDHREPPDRYHSKAWANKMESIGLMPSDTGKPGGKRTGQQMADYVIDGGPFMRATEALLRQEFRFAWVETRPLQRPVPETYIPPSWSAQLPESDDEEELQGEDDQSGLVAALYAPMPAAAVATVSTDSVKPKATRQKFICLSCLDAAWGSPLLELACLKHGAPVKLVKA